MKRFWIVGMLMCSLVSSAVAGPFDGYNCRTGIVYKTVNGEVLDMVLFLPKVKKYDKAPITLYTHGGGWGKGDKTKIFRGDHQGVLDILLENGIACASIEYRLTRRDISTAYDCVVDCKDAARFLVKHADEYGLDPQRMAAWGGSAGGHLCLMTALAPNSLFPGDEDLAGVNPTFRCIASFYPMTAFTVPEVRAGSNFTNPNRFVPFLGGPYDENVELARKLSPVEYVTKDSPPVLLLHGDKDQVLNYRSSTYMMEIAEERGADVELLTVTNGLHGFGGENIQPSMEEIHRIAAGFMIKHLLAE